MKIQKWMRLFLLTFCMFLGFESQVGAQTATSTPIAVPIAAAASAVVSAAPNADPTAFVSSSAIVSKLNTGDTAWVLISAVLVTLMVVPGVALFYSGLLRRINALSIVAQVFGSTVVVTLIWVLFGYSLAFTPSNTGLVGGFSRFMLGGVTASSVVGNVMAPTVPEAAFVMFQLAFAMVTVVLILGSVVERLRFRSALIFAALWTALVYAPVAHWVWHPTGWLHRNGHMDFAGGTVVHITAGVAGLVLAGLVGPRRGYGTVEMPPHNLMLTIIGASLLWVGWFGFNGGSALSASGDASMAVLVTQIAACTGILGWLSCEWILRGQVTVLGLLSGLVAGLVAITPASGYVSPMGSIVIGAVGGVVCFFGASAVKSRFGLDDSLDVFGLHGVAGFVGTVLTGLFQLHPQTSIWQQALTQTLGAVAVGLYVAIATWIIGMLLKFTIGLRVSPELEDQGLDLGQHGEAI
jgi:ammonium transporter, Amt family